VLLLRNIDARGWELHLRDPLSRSNQIKYLSHGGSFLQSCLAGELDIVKAMVERTQVGLEASSENNLTPLHYAADNGNLPVVQYLCGQGADKEARNEGGETPLHLSVLEGRLVMVQYFEGLN